jgi:cysteine desulfurase/selenocysteine lyase
MNVQTFRAEFPHIEAGFVHLNHAGVSPVSDRVVSAVTEFLAFQSRDPVAATMNAWGEIGTYRGRLATLLGVNPANLAFTKNTAHGVSIVADGFKWQPGDEVVFADCEYPANSYPWLAQQDRGVVCKIVRTDSDGTIPLERYRAAMSSRTKLLAVSWVQFSTGFRNDLKALTDLAHEFGAKILVDVIQGLGALPINLEQIDVDYAATGSQKWLIGPLGVGGLYIKPDALEELRLVNMGAGSVNNVVAFDTLTLDPKPTAQRYEEGTPNIMGIIGLSSAISLLLDAGVENIEKSIESVTSYAMLRLEDKGYNILSPRPWPIRAGIVLFQHPKFANDEIMSALADAKVNVVARGGKVRFAPHFYNTTEDIDHAIDALPA